MSGFRQPTPELLLDMVLDYEEEGLSIMAIAERYEVGHKVVQRWFHGVGIEVRTATEQRRLTFALRRGLPMDEALVHAFTDSGRGEENEKAMQRAAKAWADRVSQNMERTLFIPEWVESHNREVRQSRTFRTGRYRIMAAYRMSRRAPPPIIDEMRAAGLLPGFPHSGVPRYFT